MVPPHIQYEINYSYGPPSTLYGIGICWSPLTLYGTGIVWSSHMYDLMAPLPYMEQVSYGPPPHVQYDFSGQLRKRSTACPNNDNVYRLIFG